MPGIEAAPSPLLVTFAGGDTGDWEVRNVAPVCGPTLATCARLSVSEASEPSSAVWTLRGVTSNMRYTTAEEARRLRAVQDPLGRPQATFGALIPIRKSAAWWAMAQDERRAVYEEHSRHTTVGLEYLPMIARRLHHSRDLGEPFDFLTWFEYAPEHEPAFDHLLERLRSSEEWRFVDREVDVRLTRTALT